MSGASTCASPKRSTSRQRRSRAWRRDPTRPAGRRPTLALLRAADELHARSKIADDTWASLAETHDERALLEIAMLVGHYHMVAFALNSAGVQLDDGLTGLP